MCLCLGVSGPKQRTATQTCELHFFPGGFLIQQATTNQKKTHTYTNVYIYKYVHTCTHTHILYNNFIYIYTYTVLCVHVKTYVYIYIYIYVCVFMCVMCMYMYICPMKDKPQLTQVGCNSYPIFDITQQTTNCPKNNHIDVCVSDLLIRCML